MIGEKCIELFNGVGRIGIVTDARYPIRKPRQTGCVGRKVEEGDLFAIAGWHPDVTRKIF